MVHLTDADIIVLKNLDGDIQRQTQSSSRQVEHGTGKTSTLETNIDPNDDETTMMLLTQLTRQPTIFTMWDERQISKDLKANFINRYVELANTVVRRPADIVFLTHVLLYASTLLPSAIYLFSHFTWTHGILHFVFAAWCSGAWTLLLHNHIHNNGVLRPEYWVLDSLFPYILGPLMGHTWNSYFWHHVKHHHVENNGPGDLSSTIRYQRDSVWHFAQYEARFLALTWLELPLYFLRKTQYTNGMKCAAAEWSSLIIIGLAAYNCFRPALFTLVLPLSLMRFGMMVGNWGQHCLVDEVDPNSDYRSSITLIDEASNRHCFNDGYHTSHHLNAKRHWSEHPLAFMKGKEKYMAEGALTFKDIDYIMLTVKLLTKDYATLAKCLVPMGEQIGLTMKQREDLLRTKTKAFSEEEILAMYGRKS